MHERSFLRFGAGAAVAGGVLAVVFGAMHTGPRRGNTRLFLEDLADNRIWVLDHLGLALAFLLLLVGMTAIARSMHGAGGEPWARAAWPVAIAGVAVALVNVAVDGPVMKEVADRWSAGDTGIFGAAEVLRQVDVFGFTLWTIVLLGVAPLLFGVAMCRDDGYPAWLGRLAIGAGGLGLVTGVLQWFLGLFRIAVFALHPTASALVAVWAIAAGLVLWRRTEAEGPSSSPPRPLPTASG